VFCSCGERGAFKLRRKIPDFGNAMTEIMEHQANELK
jgi:hypothetical protein